MATDVATLAIKFQATGASSVMQTLDGLKTGSVKAEQATDSLTNTINTSGQAFKNNNKFMESYKNQALQLFSGLQDGSLKVQKSVDGLSNEFIALKSSIDPAFKASQQYASSLKILNKEVAQGKISRIEYARLLGEINKRTDQGSKALFKNTQFIQQAGFQVGDFATQVASGQSALVAFTQQFTQLAGFLGPSGPILGAIVAIGGAVAVGLTGAFSDAEEEADDLVDRIREVVDSLDGLTEAQVRALKADFFAQNQQRLQGIIRERENIAELNKELERREAVLATPYGRNGGTFETEVAGAKEYRIETNKLRTEIDQSQASIDTYFQEAKKLSDEIDELIKGSSDQGRATKEAREEIDKLNDSLKFQVAVYGQSERAIKLAEIAQLEKSGADQAAVESARALTNQLYDQIDAEKAIAAAKEKSRKQEAQQSQVLSKLDPAQAERDRYEAEKKVLDDIALDKDRRRALEAEAERQHQQTMVQIAASTQNSQMKGFQTFTDSQNQQLSAVGGIFGNMAELSKQAGKDQFDSWKIFASAQAAVNTALAISNALTVQPAPLGIALAGTIGALGIAQQAAIQATEYQASYDGGGFTGSGPRTGGIDGKGGFPAIMHPNETVIDHTKGQSMGGDVTVVINNAPQGTVAKETQDADGNTFVNVFLADMSRGGPMSRSVQSTFGVARQGR